MYNFTSFEELGVRREMLLFITYNNKILHKERDYARETLEGIFTNTSEFSAKSLKAINQKMKCKVVLARYKPSSNNAKNFVQDTGPPRNYSWRKDMETFEEDLQQKFDSQKKKGH